MRRRHATTALERRRPATPLRRRGLRWSATPVAIARLVEAEQPVAFSVTYRRRVRPRRVVVLLLPLREVVALGLGSTIAPGAHREAWLVWLSLTRVAVPTPIPVDGRGLAERLGLGPATFDGRAVAAALGEVMDALYAERSL